MSASSVFAFGGRPICRKGEGTSPRARGGRASPLASTQPAGSSSTSTSDSLRIRTSPRPAILESQRKLDWGQTEVCRQCSAERRPVMPFELPALPYDHAALEPHIDEQT